MARSFEIYWPLLLRSKFRFGQSGKWVVLGRIGVGWNPLRRAKFYKFYRFYGAFYEVSDEGNMVSKGGSRRLGSKSFGIFSPSLKGKTPKA